MNKCRTCRWWADYNKGQDYGECRFNPPAIFFVTFPAGTQGLQERPSTKGTDGCGRHERKQRATK